MGFLGRPDGTVIRTSTGSPLWDSTHPKYILPPCPSCRAQPGPGSGPILWYVGVSETSHGWRILCRSCGFMVGSLQATEQEAINIWKGRNE